MNVLEITLLASAGIIILTVVIDAGVQIWAEKQGERKAYQAKLDKAEATLMDAISKRMGNHANVVDLKEVKQSEKSPGGRHRLTAA